MQDFYFVLPSDSRKQLSMDLQLIENINFRNDTICSGWMVDAVDLVWECTSRNQLNKCYFSFFHNFQGSIFLPSAMSPAWRSEPNCRYWIKILLLQSHTVNNQATRYPKLWLYLFSFFYHSCRTIFYFWLLKWAFREILCIKYLLIWDQAHLFHRYRS